MKGILKITFLFFLFWGGLLVSKGQNILLPGAVQLEAYLNLLKGEKVGIVAHQASLLNNKTHLVDTLMSLKINVKKVFCHR